MQEKKIQDMKKKIQDMKKKIQDMKNKSSIYFISPMFKKNM